MGKEQLAAKQRANSLDDLIDRELAYAWSRFKDWARNRTAEGSGGGQMTCGACGKAVDERDAIAVTHRSGTVRLCSPECLARFAGSDDLYGRVRGTAAVVVRRARIVALEIGALAALIAIAIWCLDRLYDPYQYR
jgi:hypothetical protein